MEPPTCLVCRRTLGDLPFSSFTLVRFAISAEEEALQRELDREGWTGHHPWHVWFCDEHTAPAEEVAHLHWREAMTRLQTSRK